MYSVGVLYSVIFYLPLEERFKMENIILLGIIPGPSEPKKVMNSYLGPIVNDMLSFWDGDKLWPAQYVSNVYYHPHGTDLCYV